MNDETRTRRLMISMLAACLWAAPGCGGSGGSGEVGDSNDNTNLNDNSDNGNTNGDDNVNGNVNDNANTNGDGDPLRAQIGGLPAAGVEAGQQLQLSAEVTNGSGALEYEWGVDQTDLATLSATDVAEPVLSTFGEGHVEIILAVTDTATGEMTKAVGQLAITGPPEPPAEASLEVLDQAPVRPGEFVTLVALTAGPIPQAVTWQPDPENVLDADALFFEDQGDGIATFVVSGFLNITYQLTFTASAEYSNGGTLDASVIVTVNGGP